MNRINEKSLLWVGVPVLVIFFSYFFLLGKDCVIEINDQLDETLFTYVLNGKYLWQGAFEYPELLGGVQTGGMTVSAWIFVPLYRFLPVFSAFMVQYVLVAATAYAGMYLLVKELTGSSVLGAVTGTMFVFLPYMPVYGLSLMGGPLAWYAFLCLYRRKQMRRAYLLLIYFGLGANLVLLGYTVLGFATLVLLWSALRSCRKKVPFPKPFLMGYLLLLGTYIAVNASLFQELLLGAGGVTSHREEMVITGGDFLGSMEDVFLHSAQHAPSLHENLILPLFAIAVWFGIRSVHSPMAKLLRGWLYAVLLANLLTAVFYGFCLSAPVVDFRNSVSGFFHYFSAYRVYWIYPTTWYAAMALAAALVWEEGKSVLAKKNLLRLGMAGVLGAFLLGMALSTAWNIRQSSIWLLNKSQYKNNKSVGLMSWNDYFSEALMQKLAEEIAKDSGLSQDEYKVASLGISPAISLEAGFYCIDGYSNNYSLEYKHMFREIIAKELDKCPAMKTYFDTWGSRCYLLTAESQNYYYLAKDADFRYENLELNTDRMRELGCRYLFAGAEITPACAQQMGLTLLGSYDTPESYYRIWVYRL